MRLTIRPLAGLCCSALVLFATGSFADEKSPDVPGTTKTGTVAAPPADAAPRVEASPPKAPPSIVPKPSAPDPRPFTLTDRFFDAARRGDLAAVKLCIDKGIDPKIKDEVGRSALAMAVRDARSLELTEFLAGLGVAVDDPDAVGRTPLSDAAGQGESAIVRWLLAHGAKIDSKDIQGRRPLASAVLGGSREVVVMLIAAGADPNAPDNFGDTPLIQACSKGLDEIAKFLVEKGADPLAKDQEGRTAAERADDTSTYCRTLAAVKPAT